jgi:hypothetical protein
MITGDKDFFTSFEGSLLLNPALNDDLRRDDGTFPEVFCFDDLQEGLAHFENNVGTKAGMLPTEKESAEIKKAAEEIKKTLDTLNVLSELPPLTVATFGSFDPTSIRNKVFPHILLMILMTWCNKKIKAGCSHQTWSRQRAFHLRNV